MIDLRDLRCTEVLIEELHFARAAGRLGLTPSTLSRRIRIVEEQLGVPLFVRTSRRVELTERGRELAVRLPAALRQLDAVLAAARGPDGGGWEI